MLKRRWLVLAVVTVVAAGAFAYTRSRGMPRVAWNALSHADQYELLSLQPLWMAPGYYGHEILGRTLITDAVVRARLNDALDSAARSSDGRVMACFNPRHGVRVTHGGVTTDIVICFECRQVQVWRHDQEIASFLVSDSAQPVFDEVLKTSGVPLASRLP